jgi:hypothetical protein
VAQHIPVKFVSPANKLKYAGSFMTDASNYSQHKKAAIALTEQCMIKMGKGYEEQWKMFKGKKDDLADAFLQGVCSSLEPTKPKKNRTSTKRQKLQVPVFEDEN